MKTVLSISPGLADFPGGWWILSVTCLMGKEISWKFLQEIQTQKYMYCTRETFWGLVRMIFGMVHHRLLELARNFVPLHPVDCYTVHTRVDPSNPYLWFTGLQCFTEMERNNLVMEWYLFCFFLSCSFS